jgi:hypothetical protein
MQYCRNLENASKSVCEEIAKGWSLESGGTLSPDAANFALNVQKNDDTAVENIVQVVRAAPEIVA